MDVLFLGVYCGYRWVQKGFKLSIYILELTSN